MNASLETRKRSLIEYLAETQDESIIAQIENLLKPSIDIWDELTEKQKAAIRLGQQQLREGKRIDFKLFRVQYRQKSQ